MLPGARSDLPPLHPAFGGNGGYLYVQRPLGLPSSRAGWRVTIESVGDITGYSIGAIESCDRLGAPGARGLKSIVVKDREGAPFLLEILSTEWDASPPRIRLLFEPIVEDSVEGAAPAEEPAMPPD